MTDVPSKHTITSIVCRAASGILLNNRTGCFVKSYLLNPCLLSLAPPAPQKATLFPTTIINSLDGTIGNICKIWHSTGPLFWITEKYIIYLTNLKGHLGKISRIF